MNAIFIGSVRFSLDALKYLVKSEIKIVGVCTNPTPENISDHVDLAIFCDLNDIPWVHASDINSEEIVSWIASKKPDVIFCFGWPKLLKEPILKITRIGVIGFHPAEIPANRGRHPLIWTIVLGLQQTASTFFLMDSGADSGRIISQELVQVSSTDYALDLYEKITEVALKQLGTFLPDLMSGKLLTKPQNPISSNIWRKRSFSDGCIDWRMSSTSIYNLIRALSPPYPGAHFVYRSVEYKVWKSEIIENFQYNIEPGKVLSSKQGFIEVKCGEGAIRLEEIQPQLNIEEGMYL